jgi:hypothetical protein
MESTLTSSSMFASSEKHAKRIRGINFTVTDDILLCKSYCNVSNDPLKGVDQKLTNLWESIEKYFDTHRLSTSAPRTARSLQSRWSLVAHDVAKFIGNFTLASSRNGSGTNSDGILAEAHALYVTENSKPFLFQECWEVLRSMPRFMDKMKEEDGSSVSVSSSTISVRPIGNKAAKREQKDEKSVASFLSDRAEASSKNFELMSRSQKVSEELNLQKIELLKIQAQAAQDQADAAKIQAKASQETSQAAIDNAELALFQSGSKENLAEYLKLRQEQVLKKYQ